MTKKEFLELFRQTMLELYNDPEKLRKVKAEYESTKMEHPEFFERIEQLSVCDMTTDEFEKMINIIKDHNLKSRMAN
jgi:hypothetical protein